MIRQILFVQGGGAGAHDDWDHVLIAAPFAGEGGWPADGFKPVADLGARLPPGVPLHVFHGLQDETAPPSHADLYAQAVPQAQVHRLPERDHQLNGDLREVAEVIISRTRLT